MNKNSLFPFLLGGILGSIITYIVAKNKIEAIREESEEEIRKIEDYYSQFDPLSSKYKEDKKSESGTPGDKWSDYIPVEASMKKYGADIYDLAHDPIADYHHEYYDSRGESINHYQKYLDNYDEDEITQQLLEEEGDDVVDDAAIEENERRSNRKVQSPKIISHEDADNIEEITGRTIDISTLYYYTGNHVLATEDDEEIENAGEFIGNALNTYGFATNDEKSIYVFNDRLDTVYEVIKLKGAYFNNSET